MKHFLKNMLIISTIAMISVTAFAQQQFTQTVTTQNTGCNTHCTYINAAGFTNDPNALIFAKQDMGNGATSPSNLIGALYRTYERKWSIYNLNGAPMAGGTTFTLEYYPKEDANHFVLIVPQKLHSYDEVYIDHAGLNNNPDAQIRIFPTNPSAGNALFNYNEVQTIYVPSASKWIISNKFGGDVPAGVAYNIMFSNGGPSTTNINSNKDLNGNIQTPIKNDINATNGKAGGDLSGTYPDPTVIGLQGKPLSNVAPTVGQVLKWNGSEWKPMTEPVSNVQTLTSLPPNGPASNDLSGTYPGPTVIGLQGKPVSNVAPAIGQVMKWNGSEWKPAADEIAPTNTTPSNTPTTAAAVTQTFFKNGTQLTPYITDMNSFTLIELTHIIVLTKKSRLVISATADISSPCDNLVVANTCPDREAEFSVTTFEPISNGTHQFSITTPVVGTSTSTAVINNFMIDLIPGTYTVEFKITNKPHSIGPIKSKVRAKARQSSIMVIPLE